MPKTITYAQLFKLDACQTQLDLFRKTFGEEVTVSHDLVQQAVALKFSVTWAVYRLLLPPARAAYEAAMEPAEIAYAAAMTPAHTAYEAAVAQAGHDDAAVLVFDAEWIPARAAFDVAIAHAFVDAYLAS